MSESWGGTGSGWGNPVVGATALRIPAINSPNFNLADPAASPTPSWAILQSGLAYFFGLTLTGGTITGPDYIIDPTGIYLYSGTPALGNLAGSWVPSAATTTDPKGNTVFKDFTVYGAIASFVNIATANGFKGFPAVTLLPPGNVHNTVKPQVATDIVNAGAANEQSMLVMSSGKESGQSDSGIQLFSASADGTTGAASIFEFNGTVAVSIAPNAVAVNTPVTATAGTAGSPTLLATDTWHPMSLLANWSTVAGQPIPSYKLGVENRVHVTGAAQFNVNIANTALATALPVGIYRPLTQIYIAPAPGSAGLQVSSNGGLVASQIPGAATQFCNFNGSYPLDL